MKINSEWTVFFFSYEIKQRSTISREAPLIEEKIMKTKRCCSFLFDENFNI